MCLSRLFEHSFYCMQQRQQPDGYSTIFGGVGIIGDTSQVLSLSKYLNISTESNNIRSWHRSLISGVALEM